MNIEDFRTIERSDLGIRPNGLQFVTVKSRALGRRADLTLFVPPEAQGVEDLPIVILLHGVFGSHWAWSLKGAAHLTASRLIRDGSLPPVALLMPSDGLWGDGSGYVKQAGEDAENWIIQEVPALAHTLIDGCTRRSPLLIAGLSMGGFGALRLAGKYPHHIAAAAAMSAITDAEQFDRLIEETRSAWSQSPADRSVVSALIESTGPLPPIRFDCGADDPYVEGNRALHRALQRAGISHRYVENAGGHDWPYWSRALEDTLRFFGEVLGVLTETQGIA
jgi:putative tributyrin esterase